MRTALITGASGGLGQAIARGLLEDGLFLMLHYRDNPTPLMDLKKAFPSKVLLVKADLTRVDEIKTMVQHLKDTFGRIDLLINNAGVTVDKLLLRLEEEEWDYVMKVNLTGAFLIIKESLGLFKEGGLIINILSRSGLKGRRGQTAYASSKAGLLGLTKGLARELAPKGIRVNAIVPGYLPVGMGPKAPEAMEKAKEESILGRLGSVEDILRLIRFLIEGTGVTGQVFVADSRPY